MLLPHLFMEVRVFWKLTKNFKDKTFRDGAKQKATAEITRIQQLPDKRRSDQEIINLCDKVLNEIKSWEHHEAQKRGSVSNREYLSHRPELALFLLSTAVLTDEFRKDREIFVSPFIFGITNCRNHSRETSR